MHVSQKKQTSCQPPHFRRLLLKRQSDVRFIDVHYSVEYVQKAINSLNHLEFLCVFFFLSIAPFFDCHLYSYVIVGQFGTGQFSTGQFGTGQFGTKIIKADNLAPR